MSHSIIKTSNAIRIMSIDIGIINFSYCIEEHTPVNSSENSVLRDYYLNGTVTHMENCCVKSQQGVITLLDGLQNIIKTCNGGILIEQQMRSNQKCVKMQQHVHTYFMCRNPELTVVMFPARFKTTVFTADKMTKYQRKKYSVQKALELLQSRKDMHFYNLIKSSKKKDDMADVLMQLQAYKKLFLFK